MKKAISVVLVFVLALSSVFCFSAFAEDVPDVTETESALSALAVASSAQGITAVLQEGIKTLNPADFFVFLFRFASGMAREVGNFVTAQLFNSKQVDQYTREVLEYVRFKQIKTDYDGETVDTVVASVPLYPASNGFKLMNIKVLRNVCRALEEQQHEFYSGDPDTALFTTYEHFVGELAMHMLVYHVTRNLGAEDGPFAKYYNLARIADLNQAEDRFTELIDIASRILA